MSDQSSAGSPSPERAESFDDLIDHAPICMLRVDPEGKIQRANAEAVRLFGWPTAELVGQSVELLVPGPFRGSHAELRSAWVSSPRPRVMGGSSRLQARHADGHLIPVDIMLTPLGKLGVLVVCVDRSEVLANEEALEKREAAFRRVLQSVQDVVYVIKVGKRPLLGHVEMVSEHVGEVIGYSAREFMEDPELWLRSVHPDDRAELDASTTALFETKKPVVRNYRLRHKDTGEWHVMEDRSAPIIDDLGRVIGYCGAARDITEQRKLQTHLVVTERLAAIGTLSASVAHELASPLTFVLGNVDKAALLARTGGEGSRDDVLTALDEAREGVERMRQILRDLTGMARDDGRSTSLDPRQAIEIALRVAAANVRERARLIRKYGDVPNVHANETRLSQVFLNLLLNAVQAIPAGRRGEITVSTQTDESGRAVIELTDDGAGMSVHMLSRAFEPFVTTKARGSGTGLGLFVCRAIVTELGGSIDLTSQLGVGTRARVVLPPAH